MRTQRNEGSLSQHKARSGLGKLPFEPIEPPIESLSVLVGRGLLAAAEIVTTYLTLARFQYYAALRSGGGVGAGSSSAVSVSFSRSLAAKLSSSARRLRRMSSALW
jgi:hypothetical protein